VAHRSALSPSSPCQRVPPKPVLLVTLPPLPQRAEPEPCSFSFLPHALALEPQSKELRHRSTQSRLPNHPFLPRPHSTVSLVHSANHSHAGHTRLSRFAVAAASSAPSPLATLPGEPPSSSPYQTGSPSSTQAAASRRATTRALGVVTGRGHAHCASRAILRAGLHAGHNLRSGVAR
jgi:hypothetical protein